MKSLFPIVNDNAPFFPDTVFDSFFNSFAQPVKGAFTVPKVDIEDKGNAYELTTDLPGVTKADVTVTYKDDVLTLAAKHEEAKDEKDAKKNYVRKERTSSSFRRQFVVHDIDKDGIKAAFKDGVLTVTMPKADPKKVAASQNIEIQ